jgi:hypothetical protein
MAAQHLVRGSSGSQLARAADVFKSSAPVSVSGNSTVWTPSTGKRFRLLRYCIEVTAEASKVTTAGILAIALQDSTTDMGLTHSVYLPSTSVATTPGLCYSTGWVDLGGIGFLSAAADNVLNVNLAFPLNSGKVRVRAAGTEE